MQRRSFGRMLPACRRSKNFAVVAFFAAIGLLLGLGRLLDLNQRSKSLDPRSAPSEVGYVLTMEKKVYPLEQTTIEVTTGDPATTPTPCPPSDAEDYVKHMKELPTVREDFSFSMKPWKVFAQANDVNYTDPAVRWSMIVMVKSHSKNVWERRIARLTWAQRKYLREVRMETIFIVGKAANAEAEMGLLKENKAYGDLLQVDREEKYIDVIFKTLAGMQYAAAHFPCDWVYTSADDDIMPDLTSLQDLLHRHIVANQTVQRRNGSCTLNSTLKIVCGYGCTQGAAPRRNAKDKWFVSEMLYGLKRYPPYCMGAWYSMRLSQARELYLISKRYPFFWIDDVWITGTLRLKHIHDRTPGCLPTDATVGLPIKRHTEKYLVVGDSEKLTLAWQDYYEKNLMKLKCP